jgi:hypothetical protein
MTGERAPREHRGVAALAAPQAPPPSMRPSTLRPT